MKKMRILEALLVLCLGTACATATPQLKPPSFRPGWPGESGSTEPSAARQYDESLQLLETAPTSESVARALELMMHACDGGHLAACEHLEAHATPPVRVAGPAFAYSEYALKRGIEGLLTVRCDISPEGEARKCLIIEDVPELSGTILQTLEQQKLQPMRFHGTPVEFQYTFRIKLSIPQLTSAQRLYVARNRVRSFPNSPGTWKHLARTLNDLEPGSADLPGAIKRAFDLLPDDDWLLNQMAQLRAREGNMKPARTHALEAVRKSPHNSTYLDTYATTEAALGRCAEALRAQRRAVEDLPDNAPPAFAAAVRERLASYEARCGTQG